MTYIERLRPIKISRQRGKERYELASNAEKKQYRSPAGELFHLGNGVLQKSLLVIFMMQQNLLRLTFQGLFTADEMLKELLKELLSLQTRIPLKMPKIREI